MTDELPRLPNGLLRPLTKRQGDVIALAARGLGTTEIAEALGIGYDAAKMHINAITDLLPNPKCLTPLRLVRQWAIAQEFLRQGRELTDGETDNDPDEDPSP